MLLCLGVGAQKSKTTVSRNAAGEQIVNMRGYRVQVFMGNNTRQDRYNAQLAERQVRKAFPELAVFTHFAVPHWICRVGNFTSLEVAKSYLRKMRRMPNLAKARIVRCTVQVGKSMVPNGMNITGPQVKVTRPNVVNRPVKIPTVDANTESAGGGESTAPAASESSSVPATPAASTPSAPAAPAATPSAPSE